MTHENNKRKLPPLYLEQLALEEGDMTRRQASRERLQHEANDLEPLTRLEADNQAILEEYPVESMVERIREKHSRRLQTIEPRPPRNKSAISSPGPHSSWHPWIKPSLGALSTAAMLFVLWVTLPSSIDRTSLNPTSTEYSAPGSGRHQPAYVEGMRIKGLKPALKIWLQEDAGPRQLVDGDAVQTGDKLQLAYRAGDAQYGAIVSVDGNGAVTLHYPANSQKSPVLDAEGITTLEHAYELDDAPDFERFFFVTSKSTFNVSTIVEAAEKLARGKAAPQQALELSAAQEWTQDALNLRKSGR